MATATTSDGEPPAPVEARQPLAAPKDERAAVSLELRSSRRGVKELDIAPLEALLKRISATYHPEQVWLLEAVRAEKLGQTVTGTYS